MRPLWGGSRKVFAYVKALECFQVHGTEQGVRVRRNTAFGLVLPPGWLLARAVSPWGSVSRIAPCFTLGTFLPLANKEAKTKQKITRLLHPEKVLMHENCPSALMAHKRSPRRGDARMGSQRAVQLRDPSPTSLSAFLR